MNRIWMGGATIIIALTMPVSGSFALDPSHLYVNIGRKTLETLPDAHINHYQQNFFSLNGDLNLNIPDYGLFASFELTSTGQVVESRHDYYRKTAVSEYRLGLRRYIDMGNRWGLYYGLGLATVRYYHHHVSQGETQTVYDGGAVGAYGEIAGLIRINEGVHLAAKVDYSKGEIKLNGVRHYRVGGVRTLFGIGLSF